jgi:hypothetical protein
MNNTNTFTTEDAKNAKEALVNAAAEGTEKTVVKGHRLQSCPNGARARENS